MDNGALLVHHDWLTNLCRSNAMNRNTWMALSLASAGLVVGCSSAPEPVAPVPPPNYAADPEPLPPVSINEGAAVDSSTSQNGNILGNGQSSPPTYEPEPLTPAQPVNRTYTIRKGDTFWSIATREYGSGKKWMDIAQANPSVDPKKLRIGQQILLP